MSHRQDFPIPWEGSVHSRNHGMNWSWKHLGGKSCNPHVRWVRAPFALQNLLTTKPGWEPGSPCGRGAVAILPSQSMQEDAVMADNGVELAQVISISICTGRHFCSGHLHTLTGVPLHGVFPPATWSDTSLMKSGALDTTMLSAKVLLVIYYCWKFRFSDLKLWIIQLNWRLEPGDL